MGATFSGGAQAFHCSVLCYGAWALGHEVSVVVVPRLSSTGSVVVVPGLQLLWGMWDLPRPGIELMSPTYWQVVSLPLSHQENPILHF